MAGLEPLVEPSSVAVVGASSKVGKLGNTALVNVIESKIKNIYPINPKEKEILGFKCYPSVLDVPGDIDLALLCIPAKLVPQVISQCLAKKVKAAIIFSGGFREAGEAGAKLQSQIEKMIAGKEIRILGPNCVGLYNVTKGYNLTLSPTLKMLKDSIKPGKIGFLSQSGVFGVALFTVAVKKGIHLSKMFHLGNKMDVQDADVLEYLSKDPSTKVIVIYMEDVKDGQKLLRVLKEVTKVKPVVIVRVGKTEAGSRASASHVGALKAPDKLYSALFKQGGAIRAKSSFEALNMAWALSLQPPLKGNKIGIITNSGGQGVEITDVLCDNGLDVPELSEETQNRLLEEDAVPSWGSRKNPVDLTAPMPQTPDWYFKSSKILLETEEIDGLIIVVLGTPLEGLTSKIVEKAEELLRFKKPILISAISALPNHELLTKRLVEAGFPVYMDPYTTARCMVALYEYGKHLKKVGRWK
ncbi:MAG TPA: hypothetical protein ENG10_03915 [Candidatus Bathyarchaeota archaeon]|nr:hypothetical protein [Candidatus Bathyarchaeota archaeon]HEX69421.1 hypothetical protein [Candidatus Bathyarchaeota archaeon]